MLKFLLFLALFIAPVQAQEYFDLVAFDIEYQVVMDIVGIYPRVDVTRLVSQGEDPKVSYDIHLWIKDRPREARLIQDVALDDSFYFTLPICGDPLVAGLYLLIGNGYDKVDTYIVYASDIRDGVLKHTFLRVKMDEELVLKGLVNGCNDF